MGLFKDGKLYLFNQEEGNINLKAFESSIFFSHSHSRFFFFYVVIFTLFLESTRRCPSYSVSRLGYVQHLRSVFLVNRIRIVAKKKVNINEQGSNMEKRVSCTYHIKYMDTATKTTNKQPIPIIANIHMLNSSARNRLKKYTN